MSQTVDIRSRRSGADSGRVPPHNLQAEESLLGAMLLSQEAIIPAVEACSASDFYKPAHGHIFDAIISLWGRGEPADPVTVADELGRADLLEAIGGPSILVSLQANTPATSNAGRYARIVEEHALLRRLIGVAGEIAEMGYGVPEDVIAAVDHAEALMFDVAQRRVSDTLAPIRELLLKNLDRLEQLFDKGESITGVPTGFNDLDERLSGLQPSALVIVGARPAMGKCVAWDTQIVDPVTGEIYTAAEIYRRGEEGEIVDVMCLDENRRLQTTQPSAFIDDGIKPLFRVRTRLGRQIRTTLTHPFLTPDGWRPLGKLKPGHSVAVPKRVAVFGIETQPESELALLAHLLSMGGETGESPSYAGTAEDVIDDAAVHGFRIGARAIRNDAPDGRTRVAFVGRHQTANPVVELLRRHGVLTCAVQERELPSIIWQLPREQMAFFLRRLMATGTETVIDLDGPSELRWSTRSEHLARDVQHLMLRFGFNAELRARNESYVLALTDHSDLRRFEREIGLFAREDDMRRLVASLVASPSKVLVGALESAGPLRSGEVATPTLWESAAAFLAEGPARTDLPADADIRWDEIVSIDYVGDEQVYDLTVPIHHNFVANDFIVHNTAFALNVASHAALQGTPTLYFSLEMSHLEITQRLLCAEARVDASRLRNGRLLDTDWPKINHAIGRLGEAPIFIDDKPNLTVMDIRAKARRLKASTGGLGLVVIDYLQLMSGRSSAENRQVEVSEMSRGLKILARELDVPVIALSQLSRNLEMRADKRPVLADLRESGCLTASTRIRRADNGAEVTIGELYESGERNIPVWTLDDRWKLSVGTMTHAFSSGVKEVFRMTLRSGRTIEATANHPFRMVDEWRPLSKLKAGSRIAVPREMHDPDATVVWSEEKVVMLAHLLGDGCVLARQPIHYTSADPANLDAVEKAAAYWGITPRRVAQKNWWHTYLPSPFRLTHGRRNPIQEWWVSLGLYDKRSWEKFVPDEVFAMPRHQIRLFLNHLWATDGHLGVRATKGRSDVTAYYVTTSRRLADGVQALLARVGIQSRICVASKEGYRDGYHVRIYGSQNIRSFVEEVGVHGKRGENAAALLEILDGVVGNPNVDTIPFEIRGKIVSALKRESITHRQLASALNEQYCGSYLLGNANRSRTSSRERLGKMADVLQDKELRLISESEVFWDEVVAIEPIGEQQVFDATVNDTHNFVANDIIVHNSLEQDADVVMFLYRDEIYNAESPDKGTAEILVSKHRNGPVGTTQLAFIDRYTRFANMARV